MTNIVTAQGPRREIDVERFILKGTEVRIGFFGSPVGKTTIEQLIFDSPLAKLAIRDTDGIYINESITSLSAGAEMIASTQSTAQLFAGKNICVEGPLEFNDIHVEMGTLNAPDGIDDGNNQNIDFTQYTDAGKLYWIGGTGVWDDQENWSFSSGACPAGTGAISTCDTLIFDNKSFQIDDNQITFPGNRTAHTMLFKNSNVQANVYLPFRLRLDNIYVDGGQLFVKDRSAAQNRALQVFEEIHVINNGMFTIDTSTVQVARRSNTVEKSALYVDATSSLIAESSSILVSGHGSAVTDPTVLFEAGATIDIDTDNSLFKTFAPLSGQSQNTMTFDMQSASWENFELDNSAGSNQDVIFSSDFNTKAATLRYGNYNYKYRSEYDCRRLFCW